MKKPIWKYLALIFLCLFLSNALLVDSAYLPGFNVAVPNTPTANSLNDILSKADGSNTFNNTTDSLEAIAEAIAGISIVVRGEFEIVQGTRTVNTYATLLTITGSGIIHSINCRKFDTGNGYFKFTIDGNVEEISFANATNDIYFPSGTDGTSKFLVAGAGTLSGSLGLEFQDSFLAEYKSDGSNNVEMKIIYGED